MRNTKLAVTLLATLLLGGCASLEAHLVPTKDFSEAVSDRDGAMQALQTAPVCCRDFAAIDYRDMKIGALQLAAIDAASPVYRFAEGNSYFAAYRLPTHSGDLRITLEGIMDRTLFNPRVLLLDSRFQITRSMGPEVFTFEPGSLMGGNSVSGTFTVDRSQVGNPNNESYLLVYTDASRLNETIAVPSDATQMAKAKAVADYGIKDAQIPHSPWGVIRYSVTDLSGGEEGGNFYKPAHTPGAAGTDQLRAEVEAPQPEVAPHKLAVEPMSAVTATPAMLSETEAFYQSQIEKAVKAGDIDKAMKLVNEAERAGSTKAKNVFIDAVKRSQK